MILSSKSEEKSSRRKQQKFQNVNKGKMSKIKITAKEAIVKFEKIKEDLQKLKNRSEEVQKALCCSCDNCKVHCDRELKEIDTELLILNTQLNEIDSQPAQSASVNMKKKTKIVKKSQKPRKLKKNVIKTNVIENIQEISAVNEKEINDILEFIEGPGPGDRSKQSIAKKPKVKKEKKFKEKRIERKKVKLEMKTAEVFSKQPEELPLIFEDDPSDPEPFILVSRKSSKNPDKKKKQPLQPLNINIKQQKTNARQTAAKIHSQANYHAATTIQVKSKSPVEGKTKELKQTKLIFPHESPDKFSSPQSSCVEVSMEDLDELSYGSNESLHAASKYQSCLTLNEDGLYTVQENFEPLLLPQHSSSEQVRDFPGNEDFSTLPMFEILFTELMTSSTPRLKIFKDICKKSSFEPFGFQFSSFLL
jgi:hypothetical protein